MLIGSSKAPLAVAGYPDSGKLQIWACGREAVMLRNEPLDYWEGES